MDQLPKDRIDAIPVKQPEHLVSEAMKKPPAEKFSITKEKWDDLVAKYGEEKVNQFYKLVYTASVDVKTPIPVTTNG
jgi:hypothetical protein